MKLGITGHQNIPDSALVAIRSAIEIQIQEQAPTAGISSLAKGADQLFAECVISSGLRLEVVVPCKNYESTFDAKNALKYSELSQKADRIETLDFPSPSEEAFLAAGRRIVELSDVLVAIWDGKQAVGKGGTADIVAYARSVSKQLIVIWPQGLTR